MRNGRLNIQFCGFGGQGIVLSAIIFGTAAVTKAGLNAVQTQSYGSEARGGECQAEVIVSKNPIDSPLADEMDLLIVMSQQALNKYVTRLRSGGALIFDPGLVKPPERADIKTIEVPATKIASKLGVKLSANMVMLGFLQHATGLFSVADLLNVIRVSIREQFVEINLKAAKKGIALARDCGVKLEV
jgi:2-oxoglutarate ferredoxin oxidoreductase subunit gamma